MKLVIFDIDGTITDSVKTDDNCFIKTFFDLYQIDLKDIDWNNFKNVTDTGLTIEIFEKWLDQTPSEKEIKTIKNCFYNLLETRRNEFTEIKGVLSFIELIVKKTDFEIGFATGGWKETAELKCNSIGLNLSNFIFKSSNDHFNRAKIIDLVINEALIRNNINQFESIFYFGDGLWDLKATLKLGINFIGVDSQNTNQLKKEGVKTIIKNYEMTNEIINLLENN